MKKCTRLDRFAQHADTGYGTVRFERSQFSVLNTECLMTRHPKQMAQVTAVLGPFRRLRNHDFFEQLGQNESERGLARAEICTNRRINFPDKF